MSPQAVEPILQPIANSQPCPDPRVINYILPPFLPPVLPNQRCQGNAGYKNFLGRGIVDALKAVTAK